MINDAELKAFLDEKVAAYNTFDFIENDPFAFHIDII